MFQDPSDGISIEELVVDPPGAGEIEVRMLAAGVCHSDLHTRDGDWPLARLTVLGHEGAAEVASVGAGVEGLAPGDRVVLSWNAPCGTCLRCVTGRPWLCVDTGAQRHAMTDGTTRLHRSSGEDVWPYCGIGVFCERTIVPATAAIRVPPRHRPAVAALIGCAVATGVGAVLNTAQVEAGSAVAVVGCGGVGLSVIMGAALSGATPIIAIDSNPAKLELARELGATHGVLADGAGRDVAAICPGGGPDYVFEVVGAQATLHLALSLVPRGGTLMLVGMAAKGERVRDRAVRVRRRRAHAEGIDVRLDRPPAGLPAARAAARRGAAADRSPDRGRDPARRPRRRARPAAQARGCSPRRRVLTAVRLPSDYSVTDYERPGGFPGIVGGRTGDVDEPADLDAVVQQEQCPRHGLGTRRPGRRCQSLEPLQHALVVGG